jgi:hypothetical protein
MSILSILLNLESRCHIHSLVPFLFTKYVNCIVMNQEGKEGSEINEAHSARDISSLERKKHTFFFYTSTLGLHMESKQILLASLSLSLLFSTFFVQQKKNTNILMGATGTTVNQT